MNLRKNSQVLSLVLLSAISTAEAYFRFMDGVFLHGYVLVFAAWTVYFAAHYRENGCFVDRATESTSGILGRLDRREMMLASFSVIALLTGIAVMAAGISAYSRIIAYTGASLSFLGYAAVHRTLLGEWL